MIAEESEEPGSGSVSSRGASKSVLKKVDSLSKKYR